MKSGKRASWAVLALLAAAASPAWAGTCSFDLPQLLGDYTYGDLGGGPDNYRTAIIETLFRTDQVQKAVLYLSGTLSPGSVRGDGIQREATTVPMPSEFSFSLAIGDYIYLDSVASAGVPFSEQREYTGPFNAVVIMPGEPCPFISQINFGLGPNGFCPDDLPHWLIPPPGWPNPTLFLQDLEFVTPISGTITEARLVIEGPGVPEPATLSLLALGGLLALRRRARR
ncbi:MAG: PEP-CTERM sorting domain-containing protein [Planctomycetota bacterium]|nr:PEP-CTERM sorting domain-containing protein [Planctomycetota bacterium]